MSNWLTPKGFWNWDVDDAAPAKNQSDLTDLGDAGEVPHVTDVSSNDSGARLPATPHEWKALYLGTFPAPDLKDLLRRIGVGLPQTDGLAMRREAFRQTRSLEAQLAEAQEANRVLAARCDELAGERDAMRPVVEAAVKYDEADDARDGTEVGDLIVSMRLAELVEHIIEYRASERADTQTGDTEGGE